MNKIIYDCIDSSPYYENPADPYFDEEDAIELPSDDQVSSDYRKYPYGPSVTQNTSMGANLNSRGVKINKYYNTLKPYYVKQNSDSTDVWVAVFERRGREFTRTYRSPPD